MDSIAITCATRPSLPVRHDASGPFPTLVVERADGRAVSLHGRRNPVADADQWLATVLRDDDPPVIVLVGPGLGYVLDALERRGSDARVLAMEPFADAVPLFRARRDWSAWLRTGRLHLTAGPAYEGLERAWSALDPPDVPPVIVNPALAAAFPDLVAASRGALTRARRGSRLDPHRTIIKQSMLHPDVLTSLEHFAASVTGVIVEIGAYVGGATIAMARGVRDSGHDTPIVTIEPGGAHPGHPHLPSTDIGGDLRRNLRSRGLEHYVTVYEGFSSDQGALATVASLLAARGAQVAMLCIDADGQVQRDFDLYLPLCADGCLLSVDDYLTNGEHTKAEPTQAAVGALLATGRARELGVYGYGTWMGVYCPNGVGATAC